jgi:methylthioribose-1-phosphate isomerase
VDLCVVGCDRVAANGDTANKIGTFNLALAAKAHKIPFYVVGPTSTIDKNTPDGNSIPVEERSADEILTIEGQTIAPIVTPVFNPSFDVTPHEYISAIITEKGIFKPPFSESINNG